MANILCIGIDESSMTARSSALQRAGHTVSQARDIRQVEAACSGIQFDVVLIGQSLPAKEKLRVYETVRQSNCGAKILELHTGSEPELTGTDDALRVSSGVPEALVEIVNRLTARRKTA